MQTSNNEIVIDEVLFAGTGSLESLAAVAVLVMPVALPVFRFTLTTIWKVAVSPRATAALLNTMLPVPPGAGAEVLQPAPIVTLADTNVVLVGTVSVTFTLAASLGPL